jgi:hypothetical protein
LLISIALELPGPDPRDALYERLKSAPPEHAEALEGFEQALKEGLAEAQKPIGLWEVVQKLFSQESRRVLIATASILEGVGKRPWRRLILHTATFLH